MELTSEQQRVMDAEYQQHDAFNYPQEALYAAGAALLEYEYHRWIITLSAFRKDLDAHNLHGHYNLFQEHFAEFFPAPAEGAKAEGQAQPLKVAFKRSNRVTANQQAFEDAEYAAPRAESQDNVKHTPWRTEAMTAALASASRRHCNDGTVPTKQAAPEIPFPYRYRARCAFPTIS